MSPSKIPSTPAPTLAHVSTLVNTELRRFFSEKLAAAEKLDTHHKKIVDMLEEFVLRGGKRIRPYLCWCAYMLAGGKDESKIIRVATALELLHQYLLIIDDVADRDTVRHGGPTLEIMFRTLFSSYSEEEKMHYARSWTEIACTTLNTYIYELLRTSGFQAEKILEVIRIVDQTMLEDTTAGWKLQMLQNHIPLTEAKEEDFMKGLTLVTARYTFVGPLLIGATLAGASQRMLSSLEQCGMHVGTAFQLHDDILGLFGEEKETGKAVGNDVREGKKTLLLQYAYRNTTKDNRKILEKLTGSRLTAAELKKVQQIVKESRALDHSQQLAKQHVQKGITALNSLNIDSEVTTQLKELAEYCITRSS